MQRAALFGAVFALFALPLMTMPTSAAKDGQMCGGIRGVACEHGMFCEYPEGRCKIPDLAGVCKTIPKVCPLDADAEAIVPVCGCNGKEYSSDCERMKAGMQKDHDGPCK